VATKPRRAPPDPPVEIVLTEEELAAIIRETTVRSARPAPPGTASPGPGFADPAFSLGVRSPGAVGDAIRMILEATTLDRGRRMGGG
jgi:hypothetical protein